MRITLLGALGDENYELIWADGALRGTPRLVERFERAADEAGDDALRAVAGAVAAHARSQDLIARFGGEEFCLLLPQREAADVLMLAERLRRERQTGLGDFVRRLREKI